MRYPFLCTLPLFSVFILANALFAESTDPDRPEPACAPRHEFFLEANWRTAYAPDETTAAKIFSDFERPDFNDTAWRTVSVPHNWDDYYGFRQFKHGNLHGHAAYRTTFAVPKAEPAIHAPHVFLFFEGVGSYARVWVNGREVGAHTGGLTTFTLDVTDAIHTDGTPNTLAVRADHPANIRDLPWICGGCEPTFGFSEGTQPFGIHRPVRVVIADALRIEPFGIHVWNDDASLDFASKTARLHATVEIKNHSKTPRTFTLVAKITAPLTLNNPSLYGEPVTATIAAGETIMLTPKFPMIANPQLWQPNTPLLYTFTAELHEQSKSPSSAASTASPPSAEPLTDAVQIAFGLRSIYWPAPADAGGRFLINGEPFFINGVAEYEHLLGGSHAFTAAQVLARVRQVEAAGFNAFRDAHHPHNLRYAERWQRDGILWWPQFSVHNWFDTPAFRENFRTLLREWVRERRNNPAVILWNLQNESKLPVDFAVECAAIVRELDPTCSAQRKVVTCNGGVGADWDVPQNWSGTYAGDAHDYANDLLRQHLNAEYGAWRSIDFHAEAGFESQKGLFTENRETALLELKVRLAETVRDRVAGHFVWPFISHANPGRPARVNGEHLYDGIRALDRVGPANNKGLFTIWGEPTDAWYMYRSNYAPKETQPMAYLVSHTWPDRWTTSGKKDNIIVYSNCDEVELYNGVRSLGTRQHGARGTHFQWDGVLIDCNILRVEARVAGKTVATDIIRLNHLPPPPMAAEIPNPKSQNSNKTQISNSQIQNPRQQAVIRVNCGGDTYTDVEGNVWLADIPYAEGNSYGSLSWTERWPYLDPAFGSQRKTHSPIANTRDEALYQTFRYGRDQLRFRFQISDGDYKVELHFIEPWYGIGGGLDCTGWRLFDVAINGETQLRDVDIWREAGGANRALVKTIAAHVTNGRLEISFLRVAAGQAVISAIAIYSTNTSAQMHQPDSGDANTTPQSRVILKNQKMPVTRGEQKHPPAPAYRTHLDTGVMLFSDDPHSTISTIPFEFLECDWLQLSSQLPLTACTTTFTLTKPAEVYFVAFEKRSALPAHWYDTGKNLTTADGKTYPIYLIPAPLNTSITLNTSGTDLDLHPAAILIKQILPPAPPQIIENFSTATSGTAATAGSATTPRAISHLRPGERPYTDSLTTFTDIPPPLFEGDWIQLPCTSATDSFSFTVNEPAEICIATPSDFSAPLPAWLHDWTSADQTISIRDYHAAPWKIITCRCQPGNVITLGGAATPLPVEAIVMVRRHVPVGVFQPDRTTDVGGAMTIDWKVVVGSGDRYSMNFRYRNPSNETQRLDLQIIAPDGTLVRTDAAAFTPTPPAADWTSLRVTTGGSINAGVYRFRLVIPASFALKIDTLEVE